MPTPLLSKISWAVAVLAGVVAVACIAATIYIGSDRSPTQTSVYTVERHAKRGAVYYLTPEADHQSWVAVEVLWAAVVVGVGGAVLGFQARLKAQRNGET